MPASTMKASCIYLCCQGLCTVTETSAGALWLRGTHLGLLLRLVR